MMSTYAELHAHSNFSFLDGASHIEELVLRARELGYESLALTDHDGLHGAMEFAQCARAWGLRPITGAEVTLAPPHALPGNQEPGTWNKGGSTPQETGGHHLTLLCESQQGYANLCRLLTDAHLEHERGKPRIEREVLERHPSTAPDGALRAGTEGLIALSGCRRGEVPSRVAQGRYSEGDESAPRRQAPA